MKIQEHQIFSHFEFESGRWAVKFQLDYSNPKADLLIEAVDTLTAKVSGTRWNIDRLSENAELKFIFPSLQELFYYLAHNSKSLQVSDSSILFVVTMGTEMKSRKIPFSINLEKKQLTKQDVNQLRISLLQKRFEKQMKIKDEEIKDLRKQIQILANRFENSKIKQEKQENKSASCVKVQPHPNNPDNDCFTYTVGSNGLRVKRVMKSNWVNFIAQRSIKQPTTFKIKIWRLSNRALCLGVGTISMFGVHNYHEIQFLNYDFELQQIAVNGCKINAPCAYKSGSVVTMKCDPYSFRLSWAVDQKEFASALFPKQIRGQDLFLIAYFKVVGDQLEIWQQ